MPGAQSLALLLQPVPDQGEHLQRYYGWYSNRGMRKQNEENDQAEIIVNEAPADADFALAARVCLIQ